jgi:hypothetical protein
VAQCKIRAEHLSQTSFLLIALHFSEPSYYKYPNIISNVQFILKTSEIICKRELHSEPFVESPDETEDPYSDLVGKQIWWAYCVVFL